MNWFLYDRDLRHESDKSLSNQILVSLNLGLLISSELTYFLIITGKAKF